MCRKIMFVCIIICFSACYVLAQNSVKVSCLEIIQTAGSVFDEKNIPKNGVMEVKFDFITQPSTKNGWNQQTLHFDYKMSKGKAEIHCEEYSIYEMEDRAIYIMYNMNSILRLSSKDHVKKKNGSMGLLLGDSITNLFNVQNYCDTLINAERHKKIVLKIDDKTSKVAFLEYHVNLKTGMAIFARTQYISSNEIAWTEYHLRSVDILPTTSIFNSLQNVIYDKKGKIQSKFADYQIVDEDI